MKLSGSVRKLSSLIVLKTWACFLLPLLLLLAMGTLLFVVGLLTSYDASKKGSYPFSTFSGTWPVTYLSFVFCIGAGIISNIPHATAPEWAILAFLQQHKATLAFWADMMSRAAKVATC
jgi:hypothetical protein